MLDIVLPVVISLPAATLLYPQILLISYLTAISSFLLTIPNSINHGALLIDQKLQILIAHCEECRAYMFCFRCYTKMRLSNLFPASAVDHHRNAFSERCRCLSIHVSRKQGKTLFTTSQMWNILIMNIANVQVISSLITTVSLESSFEINLIQSTGEE